MKRFTAILVCVFVIGVTGCATSTRIESGGVDKPYAGLVARIAVSSQFKDKTPGEQFTKVKLKGPLEILLQDALTNTGRFLVLLQEEPTGGSTAATPGASATGEVPQPDLFVRGAILEYDPDAKRHKVGLKDLNFFPFSKKTAKDLDVKAGGKTDIKTSRIKISLQVIDRKTRGIAASTVVSAQATGVSGQVAGDVAYKGVGMPSGSLTASRQATVPVPQALQDAIQQGVRDLLKKIPQRYYRYSAYKSLAAR